MLRGLDLRLSKPSIQGGQMTLTASVGITGGSVCRWRRKAPQARGQATQLREKCRLQGLSERRVPERRGSGDALFTVQLTWRWEMGCLVGGGGGCGKWDRGG